MSMLPTIGPEIFRLTLGHLIKAKAKDKALAELLKRAVSHLNASKEA